MQQELLYKEEYYKIIGICMEVHKHLKNGLLEIVYKDAIEYEFFKSGIPFEREKEFAVEYKDVILKHKFYADFVVYDKIILEVKSVSEIPEVYFSQILNYLKISECRLGILVNFGKSLQHQRVVN